MDFVDGALLSSSEKPLFCRQSDKTPLTVIQFLRAYYSPSSGLLESCSAQRIEHRMINPSPLSLTGLGLR
jgi:hypothetical protein